MLSHRQEAPFEAARDGLVISLRVAAAALAGGLACHHEQVGYRAVRLSGAAGNRPGESEALGLIQAPGPQVAGLNVKPDLGRVMFPARMGDSGPQELPAAPGAPERAGHDHPAQLDGAAAAGHSRQDDESRRPASVLGHEVLLIGIGQGALMPAAPGLAQPHGGIPVSFPARHPQEIRTRSST